ncbi:hypothetical protein [Teredinibacter haidensis]|uniref:hypothetical protein n=1 Tax=Teredinibacter haidensis TaxID=2731755 RepID=UPI000948D2DE|nr:hypothetical protein [Teredinibacter haidensis]
MKNENLFDSKGSKNSHKSWRSIAESREGYKRELCNQLYSKFKPYSDRDFKRKFELEFFSAFWEMDLACSLLDSGFKLSEQYSGNKGPDLCLINTGGNRIWIEAVCATRGNSLDEVSLGEPGRALRIDSEKIMLRLTSAIYDKDRKHKHYLEQCICKEAEPFIIAVNGSLLTPGPGLDDFTPRIVKAVFEGGSDKFIFDKATGSVESRQIDYRPEIDKYNNNSICTNFFRIKEFENISALLFSESSLWSRPCETGSDYVIVHNPLAVNPLPEGYFQFGSEYMLKQSKTENESLNINNYRKMEYLYE